jgi:porin
VKRLSRLCPTVVLLLAVAPLNTTHAQQPVQTAAGGNTITVESTVPGASQQDINPGFAVGVPSPELPGTPTPRSGPLADWANRASNDGFNFHALYFAPFESNVSTGERPGNSAIGNEFRPGIDIDLDKLFGLHGAEIHFDESFFFLRDNTGPGNTYAAQASGFFPANPMLSPNQNTYLTQLTYEQTLLNDRLDIEVGRLNANHYFDLPNCTIGLTCGDPVEMLSGGGEPPAYAFWGGRIAYDLTPTWYVQFGAVENDPAETQTNGWQWTTAGAPGAKFDTEIGYKSTFEQEPFPGNYEFVVVRNIDKVKQLDSTATQDGTTSILTRLSQTIWRRDGGLTIDRHPANITAFGSISMDPDEFEPYNYFVQGGLTYTGFMPGRPLDRIGIMASWASINKHALNFERELRVAAGGPNVTTPPNTASFELDASIFITPDIALQAFAQYDINNDTFYNPSSRYVPKDGIVIGGTVVIYVGRLLGLSAAPSP